MRRAFSTALFSLLLAAIAGCSGGGGSFAPPGPAGPSTDSGTVNDLSVRGFTESWSEFDPAMAWLDGSTHGRWMDRWNGYGTIGVVGASGGAETLELAPLPATPGLHSGLVTSLSAYGNFTAGVSLTTVRQLSTLPNPWEVGWVLWRYTDNDHFYAFTPQPNGWELSKQDPAYPGNQRFLVTGSQPTFPVGGTYVVKVTHTNASMAVWVNGTFICSFTDKERPYLSGEIGLYTEEATVRYGTVAVTTTR